MERSFDIIVVGGGHAGCEAVHAAARLGLNCCLVTMRLDGIGHMPCNPSIGGPAKGHLTREIDALGGLQGSVTDATYVNVRMLNTGKGASVQALRAQSDRIGYSMEMRRRLELTPNITLVEGEVTQILTQPDPAGGIPAARGVMLADGRELAATRVVICPGTFSRAVCFVGDRRHEAGRWGENSAMALGHDLEQHGIRTQRLKTGTSPRIDKHTIDYTALTPQLSEWRTNAFSNYEPSMLPSWFLPCWLTRTTDETCRLILEKQHTSALYSGAVTGTGPRYCPSIEDKVVRFPDVMRHPIFIEPDGLNVDILYLQGLSTSLPLEVQREFLATIPGLEHARIRRPGYAVEYDAVNPLDLTQHLESRQISGLYCAGQFNGTSGYEEAAAQGLGAGANAALSLLGRDPLPLTRENSYIGVLLDDLTTRGTDEPYRMLTARCEHRLLLRHDNAFMRLGPIARDAGLLSETQVRELEAMRTKVYALDARLAEGRIPAADQAALGLEFSREETRRARELMRMGRSIDSLLDILEAQDAGNDASGLRPETPSGPERWPTAFDRPLGSSLDAPAVGVSGYMDSDIELGSVIDNPHSGKLGRSDDPPPAELMELHRWLMAREHVAVEIVYEGYLERARAEIERVRGHSELPIPAGFEFHSVEGLMISTRQLLTRARPATLGQAGRVSGVTPADMANLLVALRRYLAASELIRQG
ncbi:tRNA uridine-5-carboxymethylaminomethyl(34) synthesis enzyme MnmG [bacterium]|nr:tRNA uridine-5-carboxymethylaminomethyl(34) synthesis enzyme MnmG [bacterium]UNM09460.1 MAG: tRNA uridine-5-carboxymethylaminomethyl(34) synthesis enzyme MnmG [Planctomycetales bacterium]